MEYCLGLLQNPIRILLAISPPLREDPNHAGSQVLSFTQTFLLRGEDGICLPLPHQNPTSSRRDQTSFALQGFSTPA